MQQGAGGCVWHKVLAAFGSDASGAQGPAGPATGEVVKKASASCCRKWWPVSSPSASCQLLESRAVPRQLLLCCQGGDQCKVLALFPRPPHSCHCQRKCRSESKGLMLPGDGTKPGPAHPPPREGTGILEGDPGGSWGAASGVSLMHASAHHEHGHLRDAGDAQVVGLEELVVRTGWTSHTEHPLPALGGQ